ncbi:ABC transporter substrate-binding protein [Actinotalea sp.]|uniref:ABC transporter substrate-binding protein n=1 Tax=Actinotalea sp. TaxID=1872145 RepID=UPI00356A5EB3
MRRSMAVATIAAITLLGACAPSSTESTSTAGEDTVGADTGEEIETLTVALPGSLASLDANTEGGILNYYVASIAQEGLLGVSPEGTLEPALATSWEQPDPSTYVFDLRDDAVFADGTPLTVDDVLFSIEQARDPEVSPGTAGYWPEIASIEQTDTWQITITLAEPNQAFAWVPTAVGALWVTSQAFWEANDGTVGTSDSLILGTGPYRATAFVPDSYAEFERVDTWWGGLPKVKTIRFEFIQDENTRLLARQSGEVDIALNVPIAQAEQWEQTENTRVVFQPDNSYVGLTFDTTVAPFDDVHVRRAIAHAADRQSMVDGVLQGKGEVATGIPTPEQLASAIPLDEARTRLGELPQVEFDLEAAADELAQSSVPDGFAAELKYPNTGPQLGKAALALSQSLATVGIDLTVTEVPIEEWLATLGDGETGLSFMWYFSTTGDPAEVITYLLDDTWGNVASYSDPEVSDLLRQARESTEPTEVVDLILEANALEVEDLAYWPLWWGQSATAISDSIGTEDFSPYFLLSVWPARLYAAG